MPAARLFTVAIRDGDFLSLLRQRKEAKKGDPGEKRSALPLLRREPNYVCLSPRRGFRYTGFKPQHNQRITKNSFLMGISIKINMNIAFMAIPLEGCKRNLNHGHSKTE
ncbi:hypothetical protein [Chitinibacter tainanensis]|uniref:hypothetical protein n=1 Tax=Chitinibacter tainanensis TaxID=230667 RepID=UPI00048D5935|nr:hypothetical protein [Chitinibacter tainanensis]